MIPPRSGNLPRAPARCRARRCPRCDRRAPLYPASTIKWPEKRVPSDRPGRLQRKIETRPELKHANLYAADFLTDAFESALVLAQFLQVWIAHQPAEIV